jgi:hypothetical protein
MADSTTRTAEIKTDKAAELAQRGYFPARGYGRCCLCRQPIHGGQYIGRMPRHGCPSRSGATRTTDASTGCESRCGRKPPGSGLWYLSPLPLARAR